MNGNGHGSNEETRLDRMERLLEVLINEHIGFAADHSRLLTAQVVFTDNMGQLAKAQQELLRHKGN